MPATSNVTGEKSEFLDYIFKLSDGQSFEVAKLLFGDWINVLFGGTSSGTPTILTNVISYMNLVSICFFFVVCAYITLASVVKTATEGEILGSKWSQSWILIRMVSAISLMLPLPAGLIGVNVSLIQILVLYIAMVGSNGADYMWRYAIFNLVANEVSIKTTGMGAKITSDMVRILYCANGIAKAKSERTGKNEQMEVYVTYKDGSTAQFGGGVGSLGSVAAASNKISFGPKTNSCGYISVDADKSEDSLGTVAQLALVKTMVDVYNNVFTPINNDKYNTGTLKAYLLEGDSQDRVLSKALKSIDAAVENHRNIVVESFEKFSGDVTDGSSISDKTRKFTSNMTSWVFAGSFYNFFDERIVAHSRGMNMVNTGVTYSSPDTCKPEMAEYQGGWMSSFDVLNMNFTCYSAMEIEKGKLLLAAYGKSFNTDAKNASAESKSIDISASCTSEESCDAPSTINAFSKQINPAVSYAPDVAGSILDGMATLGSYSFFNWGAYVANKPDGDVIGFTNIDDGGALKMGNALGTISAMGHSMLGAIRNGLVFVAAANILMGVAEGFDATLAGFLGGAVASGAAQSALANIMTAIIAAVMIILPFAVQCAYLVPLLPAIIWVAVVIGWAILLVEALAAAPLAVVQMATPEGEGITGSRMERAIALIAALMLRPSLSVVGLIASMFLVNIGFALFCAMLQLASYSVVGTFDLIGIVVLIMIWAISSVAMVKEVLKIIPTLGNDILEWFSNGVARSFGGHMASEATTGFTRMSMNDMRDVYGGATKGKGSLRGGVANVTRRIKNFRGAK